MRYLTGHSGPEVRAISWQVGLGLMAQPTSGYARQVGEWPVWAADNGCFAQGDRFDLRRYYRWLERLTAYRETCLFATAPDVVGDAVHTIERATPVLHELRRLGFKAAFVAQDGSEDWPPPWEAFDVLFIGGTTRWKMSRTVPELVTEAKRHGKWIHMGRVNSLRRLLAADVIGVDSVDGTFLAFGPSRNLPRLLTWLTRVQTQPSFAALVGRR